jgi:multiple sugar transport system permease protein
MTATSAIVTSSGSRRGGGSNPPPRRSWQRARSRAGVGLAAPFFIGFLFVFVLPLGYALYQSVFTMKATGSLGLGGVELVFVGVQNYLQAFVDSGFWAAMGRVAIFAIIQIPLSVGLSLTAALLLDGVASERRAGLFRTLLLVPYMIPAVVATLIWVYLYSPRVGPLTAAGGAVGLDINFFSPELLWVAIGNLIAWMVLGFNMLILYSALRGVDRSMLEAARVDGASPLRVAWSIKLPSIRGTLVLTGLISIIGMLQIFNEPLIFRAASPETVTKDFTPIMAIYNEAFTNNNYGYAAALSVVLALVIGVMSFAFYRVTTKKEA